MRVMAGFTPLFQRRMNVAFGKGRPIMAFKTEVFSYGLEKSRVIAIMGIVASAATTVGNRLVNRCLVCIG